MNVNSLPSNEKGKNVQSMVPNKAGWEKETFWFGACAGC